MSLEVHNLPPRFIFQGAQGLDRRLEIPWMADLPEPVGRELPNGSIIVTPQNNPSLVYKFSPWEKSVLAFNEIDVYCALHGVPDLAGILRMHAISSTPDHLVRVLERSHIGSLDHFLRRRDTGDESVADAAWERSVLLQIAETMARLHAVNVVHRDLKAENILMFDPGARQSGAQPIAKVSDFDRAVTLPTGAALAEPVGSLFHMAPELLAWQEYDWRVDIYAFGMLMFEVMHRGAQPYRNVATGMPGSVTRSEFADKVVNENYRPSWQHGDKDLQRLASRCWATEPDLRPDFQEILDILDPGTLRPQLPPAPAEQIEVTYTQRLGIASSIGPVRRSMEDSASIVTFPDVLICGIFDGMRGSRASYVASRRLPMTLAHELFHSPLDGEAAIRTVFELTQSTLRRMDNGHESGSTATIAVIGERDLVIAWLGDSPAWLFRSSAGGAETESVPLINAHHPERADEAMRLRSSGAEVRRESRVLDSGDVVPWGPFRVFSSTNSENYGIAISRALGLSKFGSVIGSEPEMARLKRRLDDQFLVLGSDGLFEVLVPQKIHEILNISASAQDAAQDLITTAVSAGAPDNCSAIVVDLRDDGLGLPGTSD